MPYHFSAFRDRMREDLLAVLEQYGETPKVKFGKPRKPIGTYPHAVVKCVVEREFDTTRSVEETYAFQVEIRLPLPAADVDLEAHLFEAADRLVMRLAPFDPAAVPNGDDVGTYAGEGYSPAVTAVVPGEDEDTALFCSVRVDFGVKGLVYQ